MAVKIGNRLVTNFCLSDWLFRDALPPGTYYLTLATQWSGLRELPPQMLLVRECEGGRLLGMTIEDHGVTDRGLRDYAESKGFRQYGEDETVFILIKP